MNAELFAIHAAVQTYFDGLYEGDVEKLATVFHPKASLFIADGDNLLVTPVPEWLTRIAGRPSPISQNLAREDVILLIDRIGPTNALVKVRCQVAPKVYEDHLSFIKIDGRWQVVAKSYCQTATLN